MNINIQVDSSLFNSGVAPGSGTINASSSGTQIHVNTSRQSPSQRQQHFDQPNSITFSQASMHRSSQVGLQTAAQQTPVAAGVAPQPFQQHSQGQSLPPINSHRQMISNGSGTLFVPNDHMLAVPQQNVEQFSVNVTITKVGNQLISSRVDISKQMLPEEDIDDLDDSHRMRNSNYSRGPAIENNSNSQSIIVPTQQQLANNSSDKNDEKRREAEQYMKQELQKEWEKRQYKRFRKYEKRSLFIFSRSLKIRQYIIRLLRWSYYDYFMILSIVGNSICLAMFDYTDDNNETEWNQILDRVDQGFTVVYATEALLKIIAFGFFVHPRSYLRDPWNILDFLVVIIGIISLIPSVPNLKSLRTMRVLRPLRSINAVPSMKRLVATLLMSLPQMGYLVSFLFFFIGVMSILGMQMFARDLYYRCRLTDMPINDFTQWPIDQNQSRLCGGLYECASGTYCHALIEQHMPLDIDQVETWDFVQYGYFNFDNIGVSILSIFRVMTLEGWTNVMYNYMDSSGFIAGIYFPILVIIGSFFLLNLFLAVIMETFSEMNERQKEKEEQKQKFKLALSPTTQALRIKDKEVARMERVAKQKFQVQRGVLGDLADAALVLKMMSDQDRQNQELSLLSPQSPRIEPLEFIENDQEKNNVEENKQGSDQGLQENDENNCNSNRPLNRNLSDSQLSEAKSAFEKSKKSPSSCQNCRQLFMKICDSSWFTICINLCIITNTIVLGLDAYPQDAQFSKQLDIINIIFFVLFFIEMIIKLIGMGPMRYIKDNYNIFDSLIVTLSIVDVSLSYTMPNEEINQGRGAISAFRAFRLLRIFKLAKSWKKLKLLLQTIAKSLKDISSFSVLLFLLMFIYILLGMEIFAQKASDIVVNSNSNKQSRSNFNNFFNGFIVIFSVLTGENWDETMFQFTKQKGYIAIFFFISLIIIGVMIFLNLFLAILLENFEIDDDEEEDQTFENIMNFIQECAVSIFEHAKNKCKQLFRNNRHTITEEISENTRTFRLDQLQQIKIGVSEYDKPPDATQNLQEQNSIRELNSNEGDFQVVAPGLGRMSNLVAIQEIDEDRSPSRFSSELDNNIFSKRHGGFSGVNSTVIEKFGPNPTNFGETNNEFTEKESGQGTIVPKNGALQFRKFNTFRGNDCEDSPEFPRQSSNHERRSLADTKSRFFKDSLTNVNGLYKHKQEPVEQSFTASPSKSHKGTKNQNFAVIMYQKTLKTNKDSNLALTQHINCEGNSLLILDSDCKFRKIITQIIKSKYFEGMILVLIAVSSILLALDNPLNDPNSTLVEFLQDADIILTICFACESIFKIISLGLLFNGKSSYLRNGWNTIDFIVVIVSIISLLITSNKLKIVKILRLLRVLRPLRVISRNKGLKIGIQALFMAIPSIINVIIVSMVFFLIFGIIGVNYFKGSFFSCRFGDQFPNYFDDEVQTKWDCLNFGGAWLNGDQNFDNVAQAMSTLFQLSTTEGWIEIMNRGIDSIDIDMQPQKNHNIYWAIFYMIFIVLGNFLILNLFVGVVISTFNKEKEILGKGNLLTLKQREWLEMKQQCMQIIPKQIESNNLTGCREFCDKLTKSRQFDIFILICIILNTMVLAINWYSQPVFVDDILDYINYGFAMIFAIEAILKLIAHGIRGYFKNTGNAFDFLIVIVSIISSIISILLKLDFGASTTFIRALRITRIFKYIKKSKQIKVIFETLVVTIPALTNIGGLLLLFLYIYSVLGVFLFAEIKLQSTLNIHANFQSFGIAFLTLLRCSTGEAWDSIMMDTVRQKNIIFQCSDDDFDFDEYSKNGNQTNGCGSQAGIIFFMTFFLMVPLIFLNLFIAIILEGFEQTSKKVNLLIQDDDLEWFRDCWAQFDKDGTGFMKISDFPEFMMSLGEPFGWNRSIFQHNISLQDDCLEELFMNIYHDFSQYQFWDVLLALSKVYLVNNHFLNPLYNKSLVGIDFENESDYSIETENKDGKNQYSPRLKRISSRLKAIDPEEKLKVRLELEFEAIDNQRQDVMDVEEIKYKEKNLRKQFEKDEDQKFNSAHIKAARRILNGLIRLKAAKQARLSARGMRLNDESESKTVHTSPQLKPVSNNKRKKGNKSNIKKQVKNKFTGSGEYKTNPIRNDSKIHRDLSAIDSSNMLIDDNSLMSAKIQKDGGKQIPRNETSNLVRNYDSLDRGVEELYDDEMAQLQGTFGDLPSNNQSSLTIVQLPFRQNAPQIVLRSIGEVDSQMGASIIQRPTPSHAQEDLERRPVMFNPFIRAESSHLKLRSENNESTKKSV